jgi:tRNA(Ile)-lysidine synthase
VPRLSTKARSGPDPAAIFAPLAEYGVIGLAVSGGADSLALMLLAHRYCESVENPPQFIVYTVDHGLRSEAAADAGFVVGEAGRLGFPARLLRWVGRKPKTGLQQAARRARYALIAQAMDVDLARVLVTAHHLHDQAETVLMRLAHGSGLEGLRGMDYAIEIAGITVIRPLLGIDPAALRAVVEAAGMSPVADPGNESAEFERVRWRQMLPQLAALGLTAERLALFALRVRDADRALNIMAGEAIFEVRNRLRDGAVTIDRALLMALPRTIAIRVVQHALRDIGDGRKPHALAAVELFTDRLIREPLKATLHGCIVESDGVDIRIAPEPLRGARGRRTRAADEERP